MTSNKTESLRDREVRLGIVLYGGVSLAIYENGVARELFRAVKGEGVYTLIKELIDSDIVVDIMSGTSAGGINGIMLGYALANGRDFKASAKLWREDGDILRLLHNPNKSDATSVLDSRGYYQERLEAAYEGMPPYIAPGNDGVDAARRIVSEISEIDLFVTGTDVQGRTFTVFDEQGHPIDVKNHRQVFQLSYRENRKNGFSPANSKSLAKLSRITSCFPVAFEPVQVNPKSPGDSALNAWGKLDDRESIFFLDGGVLNNKPFSYTIEAIARRTADRDVDRMLLYVEPDPERFQADAALKPAPNIVQAASEALIDIPGYQSIASDLQSIVTHNDHVQRYHEILGARCWPAAAAPDCFTNPSPDGGLDSITDPARRCMYLTSRLGQLRDRAVEGILKQKGRQVLLRGQEERRAARILVESFESWEGAPSDTLAKFDAYFRMRRLLHMSYFIKDLIYPEKPETRNLDGNEARYRSLRHRLNHQFKLVEEIQYAMESAIDSAQIPWMDLKDEEATPANASAKWLMVQNALDALLDSSGINLGVAAAEESDIETERKEREALMAKLRPRIGKITGSDLSKPPTFFGNLLQRCDELEREILEKFAPGGLTGLAAAEYCHFVTVDSCLFPLQRSAGTQSLDAIYTVRISPIDAKRGYSARTLNEKLCGDELAHFGGFMKRSWRANDTMWGRLDAICQLIECLVTPERIDQVPADKIEKALGFKLELLFPNSPPAQWEEIREAAKGLRKRDGDKGTGDAGRRLRFERFWDALVRAAQAEILTEEVPRVVDAAIRQQSDWNQFSLTDARDLISHRQVWSVSPRKLDTAVTGYASSRLAAELAPAPCAWPIYFDNVYAVGSESWDNDIPKAIMLEIMSNSALVLRNCLLGIAGPKADKIRKSLLYRLGVNLPLLIAYKLVRMQRTTPEYLWVTLVSGLALSIGLLLIEFVFRGFIFGKAAASPAWQWSLAPAIAIVVITMIVYFYRRPVHSAAGPARDIRSALLAANSSLATLKDCLILNQAPWRPRYPGSIFGRDDQPDIPPLVTGPVENFCAREELTSGQYSAAVRTLFPDTLPVDQVHGIAMKVERVRVIAPVQETFHAWMYANAAAPAGETAGPPVVREAFEGTLILVISLRKGYKPDESKLRAKLPKEFRLYSGLSGDGGDLQVISNAAMVFACRAVRVTITDGKRTLADVPAAELENHHAPWYTKMLK